MADILRTHAPSGSVLIETASEYIMRGPTGEHRLAVTATPPARLRAHWQGFTEAAEAAARSDASWRL